MQCLSGTLIQSALLVSLKEHLVPQSDAFRTAKLVVEVNSISEETLVDRVLNSEHIFSKYYGAGTPNRVGL